MSFLVWLNWIVVFGIRCYESTKKSGLFAFRLNDHLERLANSCKLIGLELPASFSGSKKIFV